MVKTIYILKGIQNDYSVSYIKVNDESPIVIQGYEKLISVLSGDDSKIHRLKKRPLEIIALHFDREEVKQLRSDLERRGFKRIQKIRTCYD